MCQKFNLVSQIAFGSRVGQKDTVVFVDTQNLVVNEHKENYKQVYTNRLERTKYINLRLKMILAFYSALIL